MAETEPHADSLMDKLLCCRKTAPPSAARNSSKNSNGVRSEQPTWNVTRPLASNGLENGSEKSSKSKKREHLELARLTSDASQLHDPKIEPAHDLDPNVIEEVNDEELERIHSTPRDSTKTLQEKPGPSKDGFTEVDLEAEATAAANPPPTSPKSIEEVELEYAKNKQSILKEIEGEEREEKKQRQRQKSWDELKQASFTSDDFPTRTPSPPPLPPPVVLPPVHKVLLTGPSNDEEPAKIAVEEKVAGQVLNNIEAEFAEVMEEINEESDDELRQSMEMRAKKMHDNVVRAVTPEPVKKEVKAKIEEPIHVEKKWAELPPSAIPVTPFNEDDSEEEIMLGGKEPLSARSDSSPLPPPPAIEIPSVTPSSLAPLSSSSGIATSTMYSAASDDSDISEGEELPPNKRLYGDSDEDEGIDHLDLSPTDNSTRISLRSNGEATIGGKDGARVSLGNEKAITLKDEKLI